jgi:hypothetical protein
VEPRGGQHISEYIVVMKPKIKDGSCTKTNKAMIGKYYYVVKEDTYFYPQQRGA